MNCSFNAASSICVSVGYSVFAIWDSVMLRCRASPPCCYCHDACVANIFPASPPFIPSVPPLSLRSAFTICFGSPPFYPLIFFSSSSCVLCTVHPPFSFVCLSPAPSIVPPVPPISALVLPSDPAPCPPPVPPADGDPKSSCSSLDCSPFKFFFGGWLITVASKLPHKIPA